MYGSEHNTDYLNAFPKQLDPKPIRALRRERASWLERDSGQVYRQALERIPEQVATQKRYDTPEVILGSSEEWQSAAVSDLSGSFPSLEVLKSTLMEFSPWRKGPFEVMGIPIDAEWRSHRKWERILPHLDSLEGRRIADIGCNNGYYMFRMLTGNPRLVIGLDPVPRFWYTFQFLQKFAQEPRLHFELLGVEHMDLYPDFFDSVFCLGILYHHSDPVGILKKIHHSMKAGGQLIIESAGIPGEEPMALFPQRRYAKVPGTYFVPTALCLQHWMERAGFIDVEIFDSHPLSTEEQRRTEWMTFESLSDFLDPNDLNLTVEGYPAPWRHYLKARTRA